MSGNRELCQAICSAGRAMNELGLNQGTAGNISARADMGFLITPSGVAYETLQPHQIVAMEYDGRWSAAGANLKPSSEWRFHRDILRARPDVQAVVHSHPPYATALACLRRDIPAFHYMVAIAGGSVIRCADYATFGTVELSEAAVEALGDRNACLLANHGMIACGETIEAALALAVEVEALAGQYLRALSVGEPAILDDDEMARVLEKFRAGYGFASEPD